MGVEEHQDTYNGLDLNKLNLDQANVAITNKLVDQNYLYLRSDDCYKCPYRPFFRFTDQFFPEDENCPNESEVK